MGYHVKGAPSEFHSVLMAVPKRVIEDGELSDVDAFSDEDLPVSCVVIHGTPTLEGIYDILKTFIGPFVVESEHAVVSEDGTLWSWMAVQPHVAYKNQCIRSEEEES